MNTPLSSLNSRREQIGHDLAKLEKQIYDQETTYFTAEYTSFGTVLKGFDGFLTSKNAMAKNKNRVFKLDDRAFSLSSCTSPAAQEQQQELQQPVYETAALGTKAGKGAFGNTGYAPPSTGRRY